MTTDDRRDLEVEVLRDRLSRLSEASLRISQSLDFDTVLQEVLDSARALTGARYGVITLLDEMGVVQDFLGSGLTPEESRRLWKVPWGGRFFESFGGIVEPLRVRDFRSYSRSLGLPEFHPPMPMSPVFSLVAAPVRHRAIVVGIFFLAEKEGGGEFTAEDAETLSMFASQAAMVIANARRYRDEQQARADLETLIDTSPVGVAVFDARTGAPKSFNQEAVRILDGLRSPEQPPEYLLGILTIRRADGREVSLETTSMAEALSPGEIIRAEEVVFTVPDGRSVTLLMNATPIRARDGAVESLVVTLQDMTPIQELERLRAEFLAMVSHELRTPLTSIKGSITTLLDSTASLSAAETLQFHHIIDTQTDRMRVLIADLLDVAHIETGTLSISPEPTDVASLTEEARNAFVSGGAKHSLVIDLPLELPWLMADKQRMVQVLTNLFTNAARHSPESSPIVVTAASDDLYIEVSVTDEGRGIPAASLPHLFRKFARIDGDDQTGDTGLGLAICKGIVEAHGGRIWAESDGPGLGARFTFTVPTAERAGFFPPVTSVRPSTHLHPQPAAKRHRILAVDDDLEALRYIRDALTRAGHLPVAASKPEEALRLMAEEMPDLVLLDLMLPGTNGIEMMKKIHKAYDVPVIFLSAYGQDELVVRAFDSGATDYVVKPFSPSELAARIRAALRKQVAPDPSQPYTLGDLTIDYTERVATLAGSSLRLTAIEYRTLAELSSNAGRVLTYAHLLARVWNTENDDIRPIRTVISNLRRRLRDNANNPTYIFNEPRVGYRMPKGNHVEAD